MRHELTSMFVALLVVQLNWVGCGHDPISSSPTARTIVVLSKKRKTDTPRSVVSGIQLLAKRYAIEPIHTFQYVLNGFAADLSEEQAVKLRADPAVAFLEEDVLGSAAFVQEKAPWNLDRIDQADLPLDANYEYPATGKGVTAYVIDSGIRVTHNEFEGRAGYGVSFVDDVFGSGDCSGHGTHIAGILGGKTLGVAKAVLLVSVRVLDCEGAGRLYYFLKALDWIAQHAIPPAVVNMSIQVRPSDALDQAVRKIIDLGIPVVVAAGNDAADACQYSPGRIPEALTVGATNVRNDRWLLSNQGSCVDIFAPGSDILSSWNTSDKATEMLDGTSMASPHVAGAVAILLEQYPNATVDEVNHRLIDGSTRDRIGQLDSSNSPNRLLHVGQ